MPINGNEDDFDEHGLLKDGRTYRVPLCMMDGVSRAVADHIKRTAHVTDHLGDASLGLHRPGFRKLDGGNEGDRILRDGEMKERQSAYDDYEQSLVNGYKDAWGEQKAGDQCTINGRPGHLKKVCGDFVCVADASTDAVTDIKDKAIETAAAYDSCATDYLEEEWKKGNR